MIHVLYLPLKVLFRLIWNFSEKSGLGLGRFAPFVFEMSFDLHKKRIMRS